MQTISRGSLWSLANISGLSVSFLWYLADILGRFVDILGCFVPTISSCANNLMWVVVVFGGYLGTLSGFLGALCANNFLWPFGQFLEALCVLFIVFGKDFVALCELLVVFGRYLGALSGFLGALCANNFFMCQQLNVGRCGLLRISWDSLWISCGSLC